MKTLSRKIKLLLLLSACSGLIHATDSTFVQRKIALHSISMNGIISGNGFGMQYVPMATVRFGKRILFSGGPMFNATNWEKTGSLFSTDILLVPESNSYSGHTSLSANFSIARLNGSSLSSSSIAYEKRFATASQNNENADFQNLRFSGWEYSTGLSLNYRFRCGLLFKTAASFALCETDKVNIPELKTSRENYIGSLRLSAGIGWAFGKMMSKQDHEEKMIAEEKEEELLVDQK